MMHGAMTDSFCHRRMRSTQIVILPITPKEPNARAVLEACDKLANALARDLLCPMRQSRYW